MQPPYESESGLAPSLVADANSWPQPPHFGRLYGSSLRRVSRTASGCVLFWYLAATWFLSRSFPLNQKNQLGRYHVPAKSAKRSINFCQTGVKRKTLNMVDVFVPRLFVVVTFHAHNFTFGSAFIHPAEYTKASKPW